jgi:hypothetical protein
VIPNVALNLSGQSGLGTVMRRCYPAGFKVEDRCMSSTAGSVHACYPQQSFSTSVSSYLGLVKVQSKSDGDGIALCYLREVSWPWSNLVWHTIRVQIAFLSLRFSGEEEVKALLR